MGNRKPCMPMGVLPMVICMYACIHLCMSCWPKASLPEPSLPEPRLPEPTNPGHETSTGRCKECIVIVFEKGDNRDELSEEDARDLLESNDLAHAEDILKIEILPNLRMAIIHLFDSEVAAKIGQRQETNYKGKIYHLELNRIVGYIDDRKI